MRMLNNSKLGVIFDLDGTLVDSMGYLTQIACRVLNEVYLIPLNEAAEIYTKTSGNPFDVQIELIKPKGNLNKKAVELFNSLKLAYYPKAPFFDDVIPVLNQLKSRGCQLYISSNNDHDIVVEKVAKLPIVFDGILGMKPQFLKGEAHFNYFRKMGLSDKWLFAGDSLHDARVAEKNHIPFFARSGTFSTNEFQKAAVFLDCQPNLLPIINLIDSDLLSSEEQRVVT